MKINIKELNKAPDQKLDVTFLDKIEDLNSKDKVSANLVVSAQEFGINVSGNIKANIISQCDRCLNDYEVHVNIEINEKFVTKKIVPDGQKDYELKGNEFAEELTDSQSLDITDLIYQSVVVSLPHKSLCDIDCPGSKELQAVSEENAEKHIDERLEVFKTFSENNFNDEN